MKAILEQSFKERTPVMEEVIEISMLGEFKMTIGDKTIYSSINRSKKMWCMLQYLIITRGKKVTKQELIDVLWPNGQSKKPEYALKTLSYRLRETLVLLEVPYARELIELTEDGYCWNNTYKCRVDVDEFERICKMANDTSRDELERVELYEEALALYKGDFLTYNFLDQWLLSTQTYYRNIYIRTVHNMLELLQKLKEYALIYRICTEFLAKENFDEEVHYYMMDVLVSTKRIKEAMLYYEYITSLFYKECGTRPSEKITKLYYIALKKVSHAANDIRKIQAKLSEVNSCDSIYYCDYEVFKHLYQIEARNLARRAKESYLVLISLSIPGAHETHRNLETEMSMLLQIIREHLRCGDVISKYSSSQYIILLPVINGEEVEIVIKRIVAVVEKRDKKLAKYLCKDWAQIKGE